MWLFTKEAATGITRTVMPFIYGGLVNAIPVIGDWFDNLGLDQATATVVLGGLLYSAIRAAAEKWGWLGNLLIFNTKPSY